MDYRIDFGPWGQVFPVPCAVADRYLKLCSGSQLKVLLLALREGKSPVDAAEIARRLGLSREDAEDCLLYWKEAGLFAEAPGEQAVPAPQEAPEAPEAAPAAPSPALPAPAAKAPPIREEQVTGEGQRITVVHSRGKLTPSQQNRLIREDPRIPSFLELLQGVLGRPLTPYETEGYLYLYSAVGLPAECILLAVQYSRDIGKTGVRQVEKLVAGWAEKGIDSYEKVEKEIAALTRSRSDEGRVKAIFGITGRALSSREKGYIRRWYQELGCGDELVKLAYDRTVDNTGKVSFPYLDKILTRWHEAGVRTPEEAAAEIAGGPKKAPGRKEAGESSYDLAAIRRLMDLGG